MVLLALAAGMWCLALGVLFRTLWLVRPARLRAAPAALWMILLLSGAAVFSRPHETVLGGQDPGAYVNSAVSFARRGRIAYEDEMLARVAPESRGEFLYGHAGFRLTKGACLWLDEPESAVVGPWFQPAYPVLMSLVARVFSNVAVLFVAPGFALGTALLLAALAGWLLPSRWAAPSAFLFYVLNPVAAWHARCPRPELISGFFVLGGLLLLLNARGRQGAAAWMDAVLGGVSLAAAPFFHITAWWVVIPAWVLAGACLACGKPHFTGSLAAALLGLLGFVWQTCFITDCYGLQPSLDAWLQRAWTGWAVVGCVALVAGIGVGVRVLGLRGRLRFCRIRGTPIAGRMPSVVVWGMGIAFAALLAAAYWADDWGSTGLSRQHQVLRWIRVTDLGAVAKLVSRPIAALGLVGWFLFFVMPGARRWDRVLLGILLFPGIFLVGRMPHFMYFSRRIVPFFLPALALALTAWPSILARLWGSSRRWAPPAFAACLVLLGWRGRTHLISIRENAGLVRYLQAYAERVRDENGVLLCEYSRIAAVFDHFFEVPTLGLDNQMRTDYTLALTAWEQAFAVASPGRPMFFATPFQAPLDPRFCFVPVEDGKYTGRMLRTAVSALPAAVYEAPLHLKLYRMRPRGERCGPGATQSALRAPIYALPIDSGNMGLKGFANLRLRTWRLNGLAVDPGMPAEWTVPGDWRVPGRELLAFAHCTADPEGPLVALREGTLRQRWHHLDGRWWLCRVVLEGRSLPESILLQGNVPMLITDLKLSVGGSVTEWKNWNGGNASRSVRFPSRWARADAAVYLPFDAEPRRIYGLLASGRGAEQDAVSVRMRWRDSAPVSEYEIGAGWRWTVMESDGGSPASLWLEIRTRPSWDPGMVRFPQDLGVMVGAVVGVEEESVCRRRN